MIYDNLVNNACDENQSGLRTIRLTLQRARNFGEMFGETRAKRGTNIQITKLNACDVNITHAQFLTFDIY